MFDGGVGTFIQSYALDGPDFCGGMVCNDYLAVTRPDVVEAVHAAFLEAGCDVIETDTVVMRSVTGTVRRIQAEHRQLEKFHLD